MTDVEPELLDFTCPRCKSAPGVPCRSPQPSKIKHGHVQRQDEHAVAVNAFHSQLAQQRLAARWAAEDAVTAS